MYETEIENNIQTMLAEMRGYHPTELCLSRHARKTQEFQATLANMGTIEALEFLANQPEFLKAALPALLDQFKGSAWITKSIIRIAMSSIGTSDIFASAVCQLEELKDMSSDELNKKIEVQRVKRSVLAELLFKRTESE